MKTVKEMADAIGVDKQKVYRYIKQNHINEAVQDGQLKRYDEAVFSLISQAFCGTEPHHEPLHEPHHDAVFDTVLKQLEMKDKQIEALQQQVSQLTSALEHTTASLHAAQALHAGTIQQQLISESSDAATDARADESNMQKERTGFAAWWKSFWNN